MTSASRVEQIAAVSLLFLLLLGCIVILRPFVTALLWAFIIAFATWPIYSWLEAVLRGRKGLAAVVTTLLIAAVVVLPLVAVASSLTDDIGRAIDWGRTIMDEGPPDPPVWVADIPLVGGSASRYWADFAHDSARLMSEAGKYLVPAGEWVITGVKTVGQGTLQVVLSLFIAYFFYRDGSSGAKHLNTMAVRLWGDRSLRLIGVAAATMKGVIYGIIGTGIVQAILTGFALWLSGVPGALLLGVVTFFASLVPVGAALVWLPAAIWVFYKVSIGWAIFLFVWGAVVVSSADNIIKPYFISRGGDLPFILTFLGALGGVIAFGFLGIFLGPTLLAVGYNLIRDWAWTETSEAA
ncbi:MAG TPA: AI-2E family transporter [Candidatus Binatia bacterium]|jgi:predicted PurR-regulated permease PerM